MVRRFTLLALSFALTAGSASAASDEWRTERFNIVVRDQGIGDVLKQFGALAGVPVVLSEAIDSRMSARFEGATGEQILEAIAREYALDWRFDGRRIEISTNDEQVSRILDMGGVKHAELVKALEALDAYESRFPISAVDGELGMIVGPPRYVAIVEIVLAEMAQKRAEDAVLAEKRRLEALEEARLRAEAEARRIAEQLRLRALLARRTKPDLIDEAPVETGPLVNRGGRWGS